ncbi:SDR family NAD(P)-dependent oxidoreductase [Patescibacteria group bacterium]
MKLSKKTVLVTGCAGFIGSHLVKRLLNDGVKVVGIDNFNDYYSPKRKEKNIEEFKKNKNFCLYRQDITDIQGLEKIFQDSQIDVVVHLAARAGVRPSIKNPKLYEKVNVKGTKNILEMMKKFKINQLVMASSSSVYGEQEKIPFSETDVVDQQVSPYAKTKKQAEKLCLEYAKKYGIKTTVLRFFTVYGPKGRPDMAPYIFTERIFSNKTITRFGKGDTSRDYTYIDDIIEGVVRAIEKPFKFEIINLGNNKPIKLNQFIKLIEKLTDKQTKIIEQPRHPADVKRTYADIRKAKKLLGWEPKTDLETGMKNFIDWYKKSA